MEKQGIFDYCSKCPVKKNCCDHFHSIDYPIVSKSEYEILSKNPLFREEYFKCIEGDCYLLVANHGRCPFYQEDHCTIYEDRPNDCRLFPYDIKVIDDHYYLVKYILDCGFVASEENVDDIVEKIKPYIRVYTNLNYNEKLKSTKYEIVKEIGVVE